MKKPLKWKHYGRDSVTAAIAYQVTANTGLRSTGYWIARSGPEFVLHYGEPFQMPVKLLRTAKAIVELLWREQ